MSFSKYPLLVFYVSVYEEDAKKALSCFKYNPGHLIVLVKILCYNNRNKLVLSRRGHSIEGHWAGPGNDRKSKEPGVGQG